MMMLETGDHFRHFVLHSFSPALTNCGDAAEILTPYWDTTRNSKADDLRLRSEFTLL